MAPDYTSDGLVPQIEAAEAAAGRGARIVGLVFDRGVILGARYDTIGGDPLPSFLGRNASSLRGGKLLRLGPRLALAGTGLMGDFAAVARYMRGRRFSSTQAAIDCLGSLFWEHTIRHDLRVLGTFVFMGSTLDGDARLFQFSPSGSIHEYVAWAQGRDCRPWQVWTSKKYRPGSQYHAETVALRVLDHPNAHELVTVKTNRAKRTVVSS
jgi:20S proteasome alpha/beta subunit